MSFGTMVVVIVAIVAFTVLRLAKIRGGGHAPSEGLLREELDTDARREIEDLRERIKVLERIATEGNSLDARETDRIAAEIESLRERQG